MKNDENLNIEAITQEATKHNIEQQIDNNMQLIDNNEQPITSINNMNFEEAMKKLEEIATELEKNNLDLDKSVSKFEEGMKLSKLCSKMLEDAERRINVLIKTEDGFEEESFE